MLSNENVEQVKNISEIKVLLSFFFLYFILYEILFHNSFKYLFSENLCWWEGFTDGYFCIVVLCKYISLARTRKWRWYQFFFLNFFYLHKKSSTAPTKWQTNIQTSPLSDNQTNSDYFSTVTGENIKWRRYLEKN